MGKFVDGLSYMGGLLVGAAVFTLCAGAGVAIGYDIYKSKFGK